MMFGLKEINIEQHHMDHVHVRVEYVAYSSTSPSSNFSPYSSIMAAFDADKAFRTTITQMTSTLFSRSSLTNISLLYPQWSKVRLQYPVSFISFDYHTLCGVNLIQHAIFIAFLSRIIFKQHRQSDRFLFTACVKSSTSKPARYIDPFPANMHAAHHILFFDSAVTRSVFINSLRMQPVSYLLWLGAKFWEVVFGRARYWDWHSLQRHQQSPTWVHLCLLQRDWFKQICSPSCVGRSWARDYGFHPFQSSWWPLLTRQFCLWPEWCRKQLGKRA